MKKFLILFFALVMIRTFMFGITGQEPTAETDIDHLIDGFHKAASVADQINYLKCLDEDAIFLGTDGGERWTKEEFAAFVKPYFSKGIGWTYIPKNRVVHISKERKFAWFSEKLFNEKYGELRGTGVVRRGDNGWKIVQYNMTFVIPNKCTKKIVEIVKKVEKNIIK